jgi:CRP-like cAMP-binding protein
VRARGSKSRSLLDSLGSDERAGVLAAARPRQFRRGEVVFRAGDPGEAMYLIESGVFAVEVSTPAGERAMVNVLGPGAFFGELALIRSATRPHRTATVLTLTAGRTLCITGSAFTVAREAHPEVERLVVAALAQRVDELTEQLLEALYTGVDRRVYRRLLDLAGLFAEHDGDPVIPLSQEDVATMAGASRPTVNQTLQRLVALDMISLGRRQIVIRDLDGLRAAAAD